MSSLFFKNTNHVGQHVFDNYLAHIVFLYNFRHSVRNVLSRRQYTTGFAALVPSTSSSLGGNVPTPGKTHKRSKYENGRQLTISLIAATFVSYLGAVLNIVTIPVYTPIVFL
jgi:hypothetical protein